MLSDSSIRGVGTRLLTEFTNNLVAHSKVGRVIADPYPKNCAAIRCYEKAGFIRRGAEKTPDGVALIMVKQSI